MKQGAKNWILGEKFTSRDQVKNDSFVCGENNIIGKAASKQIVLGDGGSTELTWQLIHVQL